MATSSTFSYQTPLLREFEVLKMKQNEAVKDYRDKAHAYNKSDEDIVEKRVMKKILISILERLEAKISSLEESKQERLNNLKGLKLNIQIRPFFFLLLNAYCR
ncbi:Uncharacterized protein TCM_040560 [Theobroma cacao]|uniref:Uncharacterized protein n=1 Tax=Theobroma cacao TaxID=3641 RepID=A0A061GTS0_THECC|nr:Uncharacterized protein TCM_040560 [Theobroma cacao]